MGETLWNILFLLIAIGILVTVHEFGHFWVARRCGVKVLRFSVGFGQPLLRWHDRHGTEFVVAAIPLGGYVKMLDEREGEVPEALLDQAFNRKPVRSRIAIVAAGPLFNFLFAVVAYWLMFMVGITALRPILGEVAPQSIAGRAGLHLGDEILTVDGREAKTWEDVAFAALAHVGDKDRLTVTAHPKGSAAIQTYQLDLAAWNVSGKEPDPLGELGFVPYQPVIPPVLGEISPDGAAAAAGLKTGDRVLSVNGDVVNDWEALAKRIADNPGKPLTLSVQRVNQTLTIVATPAVRKDGERAGSGFLGIGVQVPADLLDLQHTVQFGPLAALARGADKTWEVTALSVKMLGKLVSGAVSMDSISGPISIARGAGASAKAGPEYFFSFLALISINLGLINLLPIPVLDGGHLMYYLIESIRGRPLSERIQEFGLRIGVTLILGLMLVAVYNDLTRP